MMPDETLLCEGISKSFFGVHALRDVTVALRKGRVLGLIGENGAGKTTLMNVLGGVIEPDAGSISLRGRRYAPRSPADAIENGVAFIHQELNLFTNLSITDNIFINRFPRIGRTPFINKSKARTATKRLLASLNLVLSPDMLVERLAPGERQLVEIAKALSAGADIIIFDEPCTSLTAGETERLFDIIRSLKEQGKSMVYISHNLGNVLQLADDVVVLRDGAVVDVGSRESFTVDKMISRMVGRAIDQIFPARGARGSGQVALEAKGLSQSGIVKDINFALHRCEVLGLFGLMGSGRTELARILFGLDSFQDGRILIGGVPRDRVSAGDSIKRGIAFVTEDRRNEGLLMEASVVDNMALVALRGFAAGRFPRLLRQRQMKQAVAEVAGSMRIKAGSTARMSAKNLSGGNQQKVVIGKWLMSEPAVFIMDEPTRGIDVGAKYEVYRIINGLAERGAGVLFISSELEELIGTCDRILVMSSGEIHGRFERGQFDRERILHAAFKGHRTRLGRR